MKKNYKNLLFLIPSLPLQKKRMNTFCGLFFASFLIENVILFAWLVWCLETKRREGVLRASGVSYSAVAREDRERQKETDRRRELVMDPSSINA